MKILIAEDDFASRLFMQEILKKYGSPHIAVNGREAVEAVRLALDVVEPYDLICLDIMMPEMDGQQALREIRALEEAKGIASPAGAKIVMTTADNDRETVLEAIRGRCDHFLTKPIQKAKLLKELRNMALI
jgi:two-component system, chemotaxis family, chemotaxis protein CheY